MSNSDTSDTSNPRIIKKYPNRRLYDTSDSRYITMMDLRQLVNDGVEFMVVDTRNGDDITRHILLQIIADQEEHGDPMFSSDFLMQLIRGYGNSMQSIFGNYFKESSRIFAEQQKQVQQSMGQVPFNPMELMTKISEQQIRMWQDWQQQSFKNTGGGPGSGQPDDQDKSS